MKTTLVIDDTVMGRLREEAALRGLTISEVTEDALLRLLESRPEPAPLPSLPSVDDGAEAS